MPAVPLLGMNMSAAAIGQPPAPPASRSRASSPAAAAAAAPVPPAVPPALLSEVRLLHLLGVGLADRAAASLAAASESKLAAALARLPGSAAVGKAWGLAGAGAGRLASLVFSLGLVRWGFDKVDEITSRELVLLLARAAARLEAAPSSSSSSKHESKEDTHTDTNTVLCHLLNFLRAVAASEGAWADDPEQGRALRAVLASPNARSGFDREDTLRAQLDMTAAQVEHLTVQLKQSLQRGARLGRELERMGEAKDAAKASAAHAEEAAGIAVDALSAQVGELETALAQALAAAKALEVKLGASTAAHAALEAQLADAQANRVSLAESVSTLMGKLAQSEAAERERAAERSAAAAVAEELAAARDECAALREERDGLRAEVQKGLQMNRSLMEELATTETNLIDVQSYMRSEKGEDLKKLEYDLAQSRLELAQAQSEKDDLEQEVADLQDVLRKVQFSQGKGARFAGSAAAGNKENSRARAEMEQHRAANLEEAAGLF